jgi:hypothetical protein
MPNPGMQATADQRTGSDQERKEMGSDQAKCPTDAGLAEKRSRFTVLNRCFRSQNEPFKGGAGEVGVSEWPEPDAKPRGAHWSVFSECSVTAWFGAGLLGP